MNKIFFPLTFAAVFQVLSASPASELSLEVVKKLSLIYEPSFEERGHSPLGSLVHQNGSAVILYQDNLFRTEFPIESDSVLERLTVPPETEYFSKNFLSVAGKELYLLAFVSVEGQRKFPDPGIPTHYRWNE